jgi:hypothetical protein
MIMLAHGLNGGVSTFYKDRETIIDANAYSGLFRSCIIAEGRGQRAEGRRERTVAVFQASNLSSFTELQLYGLILRSMVYCKRGVESRSYTFSASPRFFVHSV